MAARTNVRILDTSDLVFMDFLLSLILFRFSSGKTGCGLHTPSSGSNLSQRRRSASSNSA
jgi:hypothetical protein